jgi:ribosome biogenesis GTPase
MTGGQTMIVKALAGYYYVDTEGTVYQCRARGALRKGVTPLVGDFVRFSVTDEADMEGVVEEILPRRNSFIRPPVANIDLFLVTVAAASPEPNLELTDRFLISAETASVEAVVCVNKTDLSPARARRIAAVYRGIYPAVMVSAETGEGVEDLRDLVRGRSVAFAGASGVGKTSLLSFLTGKDGLEVADVSRKTGRGRHTTRHVEIFRDADGTRLFDTPGFTSFETMETADLGEDRADGFFPEFRNFLGKCRFDDCTHEHEPDCAVRAALDAGKLRPSRYNSYLKLLGDVREAGTRYR